MEKGHKNLEYYSIVQLSSLRSLSLEKKDMHTVMKSVTGSCRAGQPQLFPHSKQIRKDAIGQYCPESV